MDQGRKFFDREGMNSISQVDGEFIQGKLRWVKERPARRFLSKLIRIDPRKRPTAKQMLNNPFLCEDCGSRSIKKIWVRCDWYSLMFCGVFLTEANGKATK